MCTRGVRTNVMAHGIAHAHYQTNQLCNPLYVRTNERTYVHTYILEYTHTTSDRDCGDLNINTYETKITRLIVAMTPANILTKTPAPTVSGNFVQFRSLVRLACFLSTCWSNVIFFCTVGNLTFASVRIWGMRVRTLDAIFGIILIKLPETINKKMIRFLCE